MSCGPPSEKVNPIGKHHTGIHTGHRHVSFRHPCQAQCCLKYVQRHAGLPPGHLSGRSLTSRPPTAVPAAYLPAPAPLRLRPLLIAPLPFPNLLFRGGARRATDRQRPLVSSPRQCCRAPELPVRLRHAVLRRGHHHTAFPCPALHPASALRFTLHPPQPGGTLDERDAPASLPSHTFSGGRQSDTVTATCAP